MGRHAELIGELEDLTSRYPLHEGIHGQLMVALYRAGRRGDALGTYQQLRTALGQNLGLDPSRSIEDLQRAVLGSSLLDLDDALSPGRLAKVG